MPYNTLTGREKTKLYQGLVRHFEYLKIHNPGLSREQMVEQLRQSSPQYPLWQDQHEKDAFIRVFVEASFSGARAEVPPAYTQSQSAFFHQAPVQTQQNFYRPDAYQRNFWDWMIIDSVMRRDYGSHCEHRRYDGPPSSQKNEKKNDYSVLALILALGLALATAASSLVALYYMFYQIKDDISRLIYNEGWMQASLSLFSMAVFGYLTQSIASHFLSTTIFSLCHAAALSSPATWIAFITINIGLVGASIGNFVVNEFQRYNNAKENPHVIDPYDPHRFVLTQEESQLLLSKKIDPLKVECAIIALREMMPDASYCLKPFFKPSTQNKMSRSEIMTKVRELRQGLHDRIEVGNKHFELYNPNLVVYPPVVNEYSIPNVQPGYVDPGYVQSGYAQSGLYPPVNPVPSAPAYSGY